MYTRCCLLFACLGLTACGQMAIDGEVVDVSGAPMTGARVNVIGTTCTGLVGEDGHFAVPCPPGSYTVLITNSNYIEIQKDLEAPESERYDLGKQVMIAIPSSKGLFLFHDNGYESMNDAFLTRTIVNGATKTRRYCLDTKNSTPTNLAPGSHALFDNQTAGWRPFKLDAEGCAYRDERNAQNRWEVTYKDKPKYEERTLERGKKVAKMELPAGDYFIAHWDHGFFTPDPVDKHRYLGYWLHVAG
ncbi:MAG: carboxypeptidase regulatory-like domain-containing protein [Oligoflexia bacterium]|nr:carboxypeptidase regulatory-like domain-containing protein [Oligoflexia bacterium]